MVQSTRSSPAEKRAPVIEPEAKYGEKGKIGPKQYQKSEL